MWRKIVKHREVSVATLVSFALVIGGSLWAFIVLCAVTNGPIILHFDDIEGVTSVGGLGTILFMGTLGFLVVLINFSIALELEQKERFLGKIVAAITLIFATLLFIGFAVIINVN